MENSSKKISLYLDWLKEQKPYVNYSELWKKYRNDFIDKKFDSTKEYKFFGRGYLMNIGNFGKEKAINKYLTFYSLTLKVLNLGSYKFKRISEKILKLLFFKNWNFDSNHNYGFEYGNLKEKYFKKNSKDLLLYEKIFKKINWIYSYTSFKSFCYFAKFKDYIDIKEINNKTILEIGSGLCNFFTILDTQLESYTYICLDIPEMIPAAYKCVCETKNSKDIDIFLPNQVSQAVNSNADKKLIFITPDQLKDCGYSFDLLINHESFAEMNINIVNSYLKTFKKLANKDAILFLVNRLARQTNREDHKFETYTFFEDYDIKDVSIIYKEIDEFRALIHGWENQENIFYIGRI
tara:strand:+ start:426 stop:1475 length:1050 start_codon:yes stop_codon:yes gene_type:complete